MIFFNQSLPNSIFPRAKINGGTFGYCKVVRSRVWPPNIGRPVGIRLCLGCSIGQVACGPRRRTIGNTLKNFHQIFYFFHKNFKKFFSFFFPFSFFSDIRELLVFFWRFENFSYFSRRFLSWFKNLRVSQELPNKNFWEISFFNRWRQK